LLAKTTQIYVHEMWIQDDRKVTKYIRGTVHAAVIYKKTIVSV